MDKPRNIAFAVVFSIAMLAGAAMLVGLNAVVADADAPAMAEGCDLSRAEDNSTQYSKLPSIVARGGGTTLLLGTSRTKTGFGPEVREILGPTTNGALLGASFETMRIILAHWPGRPGDRVIIEASIGTSRFNGLEQMTRAPARHERLVSGLDPRPIVTAILDVGLRERGRTDCRGFPIKNRPPANASMFERYPAAFTESLKSVDWQDRVAGLGGLSALIGDALDRGLRVDVWVPPENACQIEIAASLGGWQLREAWFRGLARMSNAGGGRDGGTASLTLWDFSAYSPVTMEPLPVAGSAWRSRYFADPGHALRPVGARIARTLAGKPDPEGTLGRRLDPEMIEPYLAEQARSRAAYLAGEPNASRCLAASDKIPKS